MRVLIAVDGGVEVDERPDPRPGPGEVLVAVHSCGICGSDLHMVESGMADGRILGHEFAGRIVEVGPGTRADSGMYAALHAGLDADTYAALKADMDADTYADMDANADGWRPGQAVAVSPHGRCGACAACHTELPLLCAKRPNLGLDTDGGFAEYVVVPAVQLRALPEGMDLELGARVEPLAVALHAVELAEVSLGDAALVYGVGSIGLNVIIALRAAGAGTIVAVGRSRARREAAAAVGADVVLDASGGSTDLSDVPAFAGPAQMTFNHVFECSGAPGVIGEVLPTLGPRGTLVEVALTNRPEPVDLRVLVGRNLRLIGSCAFGDRQFTRALHLIGTGQVDVRPLVSERVSLEGAPEAFRRLRDPKDLVGVLVQPWRPE